VTPGEEDAWAFEEDDACAAVDDCAGEAEAEAEAALVPGAVDAARDGEGADEELSCVGAGCEEEGEGEENGAGLDACVFALGVGADCDGMGLDWGKLDPEAMGVVALA
jgi:hypothetical protein